MLYDTETLLWVAHKKIETAINDTITYETLGTVTGLPDTLDKEDFCRASVTSISADFNERALQCECDIDGAINHHQVNIFQILKREEFKSEKFPDPTVK